jgi:phosphonate metabolism protein PhnN/1,5-bisphosphokinase (PRPP-forming)
MAGGGVVGGLALVVGPSGVGKDSLIGYARARLCGDRRFVFARRLVTRTAADPNEDYEACAPQAFEAAAAAGRLALWWHAHDTAYGLRRDILDDIARGGVVVANVSRGAVGAARDLVPRVLVVRAAASPEVLSGRLLRRGRETGDRIRERIAREMLVPALEGPVVTIDNDGPVDAGGRALVAALLDFAAGPAPPPRSGEV